MQLYAPMAHALDAGPLCAELEDLALRELFPSSYRSLEKWLRGGGPRDDAALERARAWVAESLVEDPGLMTLVGGPAGVSVKARRRAGGGGLDEVGAGLVAYDSTASSGARVSGLGSASRRRASDAGRRGERPRRRRARGRRGTGPEGERAGPSRASDESP